MMLLIILLVAGILPMTIPLQEPPWTCRPLVRVWPAQKLMKLASSLRSISNQRRHIEVTINGWRNLRSRGSLAVFRNITLASAGRGSLDNTVLEAGSLVVVPGVVVIVVVVAAIVIATIVSASVASPSTSVLSSGESLGNRRIVVYGRSLSNGEGAEDGEKNVLGKHLDFLLYQ
jgi:hypothetical protein